MHHAQRIEVSVLALAAAGWLAAGAGSGRAQALVMPDRGPFAGGNQAVITNGAFSGATNVLVAGAPAALLNAGADWIAIRLPAARAPGPADVLIQFPAGGTILLAGAYTYNPPGMIGGPGTPIVGWEEIAGLPLGAQFLAAGVCSGAVYAVGGMNATYSPPLYTNVFRLDGGTNWTPAPALPAPAYTLAAASYSNALYTLGGFAGSGSLTNVCRFDGAAWSQVAGLPAARGAGAAAAWDGALYYIGGRNAAGAAQTNVYRYNGAAWSQVAGLPAPRGCLTANVWDGALYAIGGSETTNVYQYDGASWTEVPGLPAIMGYAASAVLDDGLYVFGGESGVGQTNVYRYDGTNWHAAPGLPSLRFGVGGAALSNRLYSIGGLTAGVSTNVYRTVMTDYIGVAPTAGPIAGEYEVVISGTNLSDGADVTNILICGMAAAVVRIDGGTQVVAIAGAGPPGRGDVRVYSASYGETVRTNAFVYLGADMLCLGTNGAAIAHAAPAAADKGTDFGAIPWGYARTNRLAITNAGNQDLTISGIGVHGAGAAAFKVVSAPAVVPPGGVSNFVAVFAPVSPGIYPAAFGIANNSSNPLYVVYLAGTGDKRAQTVSFTAASHQAVTDSVALAASASSGLPVSFAATPPGRITGGNILSFTGTGLVAVIAAQPGNAAWHPATATQMVRVTQYGPSAGRLAVSVAPAGGSWTLPQAPAAYIGPRSGTGPLAASPAPPGGYRIAWNALAGYAPPLPQAAALAAGGTLVFTGIYLQVTDELPPPPGVSATAGIYTNFVRVSWGGVAGAASYEVRRHTANEPARSIRLAEVPAPHPSSSDCAEQALAASGVASAKSVKAGRSQAKPGAAAAACGNLANTSLSYDDLAVAPNVPYYYWVRAMAPAKISRFSPAGMGYARLNPGAMQGVSDLGVSDLVFLPVNLMPEAAAGTVAFRLANHGPDALASAAVAMDFYMGTAGGGLLWLGGARRNFTLAPGAEELVALDAGARRGIVARGDLPRQSPLNVRVHVRHLAARRDPNPLNDTADAAGTARIRTAGASSRGRGLTDYDGDGKSDLAVLSADRSLFACLTTGDRFAELHWEPGAAGPGLYYPAPGDYDGDGRLDLGLYDADRGIYYVRFSSTGAAAAAPVAGPGFRPAPADYDGDGRSDPAVYREADGYWTGFLSSEDYRQKFTYAGGPGFAPVPADYDGDGLADPVSYSAGIGAWAGRLSGMDYQPVTLLSGVPDAQAVPADYDGDGLADLALYQPAGGQWLARLSHDGAWDVSAALVLGGPDFVPVPGDYDGDGRADPAVYNSAADGVWRVLLSTQGYAPEIEGCFGGADYEAMFE